MTTTKSTLPERTTQRVVNSVQKTKEAVGDVRKEMSEDLKTAAKVVSEKIVEAPLSLVAQLAFQRKLRAEGKITDEVMHTSLQRSPDGSRKFPQRGSK